MKILVFTWLTPMIQGVDGAFVHSLHPSFCTMFRDSEIPMSDSGSENQTRQILTMGREVVGALLVDEQGYATVEALRGILIRELKGKKFRLDCGHRVTFGHHLGNDITIRNGTRPEIICSLCGY